MSKNFISENLIKNMSLINPADLDMAAEAHRLLQGQANTEISGVTHSVTEHSFGRITTIRILDETGAAQMGRDPGNYITIETGSLIKAANNPETDTLLDELSLTLANTLNPLLPPLSLRREKPVLLAGLGNAHTLADAIGPKTISYIQPTCHFFRSDLASELLPVAAFTPGVVGNTGIETADLIKNAAAALNPCCIIVIDALAAAGLNNLFTTIQLCDTGIRPGSGVQNHRSAIDRQNMNCPVIAIGIPTVVNTSSVLKESVIATLHRLNSNDTDLINTIPQKLLSPFNGNLIVMPQESEQLIPLAARIIAAGITRSLHPGADAATYRHYMQLN